jgi:hypothetical protein
MTKAPLTADEVLSTVRDHGRQPTYVVKNWLKMGRDAPCSTAQVRRLLKKLEAEGKVKRSPSSYAVMICWELA